MKTSITLNEMENYFKNNPSDDKSALTLVTGFKVFFEYSAPDDNNEMYLQLELTVEHDKPMDNIEPIHVAAVCAATVVGGMSEVLILADILKKE